MGQVLQIRAIIRNWGITVSIQLLNNKETGFNNVLSQSFIILIETLSLTFIEDNFHELHTIVKLANNYCFLGVYIVRQKKNIE